MTSATIECPLMADGGLAASLPDAAVDNRWLEWLLSDPRPAV